MWIDYFVDVVVVFLGVCVFVLLWFARFVFVINSDPSRFGLH